MSSPSPKALASVVVRVLIGVVAVAVLVFAAGLPFYVFPRVDPPGEVDVVYVIGPPTPSRIELAEGMLDAGLSDTLMISVDDPAAEPLCAGHASFAVFCSRPEPFTTQGEARELAAKAAEHGWTSATVITFTPHVTRTRVLMERCFTGSLRVVADTTPLPLAQWVGQYFYQTGAFVKVALNPGC
ncbi:MAG: hypothetical protein Q7U34_13715 [Anaerolineales bacterium]|nr:hypothetical protein [Anaerolineales bacterium]